MYIFYDTETTGTNIDFDQILQFAAILVDEQLQELDRFEVRCQLLPWVVPSPMALEVTNVAPSLLNDSSLPTFYEMMSRIHSQLNTWSPGVFIGYNSIRFDEPLLQRAFWQTLHTPYLTVTGGNSRFDILPLLRAASIIRENILHFPSKENGKKGFKLDELAPLNGFTQDNAHDALSDVEATIFFAKKIKERMPDFWQLLTLRAAKSETARVLKVGDPVLVVEFFSSDPSLWFGLRIDTNGSNGSYATLLRLDQNWRDQQHSHSSELTEFLSRTPKPIRQVAMNKAPLVFTLKEAETFFGIQLDDEARAESAFLKEEIEFCSQILSLANESLEPRPKSEHVEQMLFDGFASRHDQQQMDAFHATNSWGERARMVREFSDLRLKQVAQRLIYVNAPDVLETQDRSRIERGIVCRLYDNQEDEKLWRTIPSARKLTFELGEKADTLSIGNKYLKWLEELEMRFPKE
ncbi:MAG: hypothetical protein JAY88_12965 [Candidatus Thiodiazotropha lotti]|nr:hypothetical protein [Candidatus Thiodiazotropha lotti]MCW4187976.1 exonuclease domain-containing protein [Candidatus Thiodiazotropha lotti]